MNRTLRFVTLLLLAGELTHAQRETWSWKDKSGNTHSRSDLNDILEKHGEWIESRGKPGTHAKLDQANLEGADFHGEVLSDAWLSSTKLARADLDGANLERAFLPEAILTDADLSGANLEHATLYRANLNNANLEGANLTDADLQRANLAHTLLIESELTRARIRDANLDGAIFELKALPDLREISRAGNLELLTYANNPDCLIQLRKQFEDAGFREQARKITYALKRREVELCWEKGTSRRLPDGQIRPILLSSDSIFANCSSFILNKTFLDWTCQYGLSPGRPLALALVLWFLCSLLYFWSVHGSGATGLFRIYPEDPPRNPGAKGHSVRISSTDQRRRTKQAGFLQSLRSESRLLRVSMFFSLMSAFNIGFRDINFGRWLRLLTRQEFDIKAVGWARVVAGWQSLISVYLIALWVVSFGLYLQQSI
jgi:hypothetical protein